MHIIPYAESITSQLPFYPFKAWPTKPQGAYECLLKRCAVELGEKTRLPCGNGTAARPDVNFPIAKRERAAIQRLREIAFRLPVELMQEVKAALAIADGKAEENQDTEQKGEKKRIAF